MPGVCLFDVFHMPDVMTAFASSNFTASDFIVLGVDTGAYLSWWKLLLIVIIWVLWVKLSDGLNRDAVQLAANSTVQPSTWNVANVLSFLAGLLAVLFVPIFWAGFPLFLIAALVPPIWYRFTRNSLLKADKNLQRAVAPEQAAALEEEVLAQDQGVNMSITPAGGSSNEKSAALIQARRSENFVGLKTLLYDGMFKRADLIALNYTQASVALRMFIDGVWHTNEPLDRPSGDALLVSLKHIAGLNPADRRGKQSGAFSIKSELGKADLKVQTQGTPTGEQVTIKYVQSSKEILTLQELGMFPDLAAQLKAAANSPGICIVSAPKTMGLTSTWQGFLTGTDRLSRDCMALLPPHEKETSVENIGAKNYATNDEAVSVLQKALLAEPNAVAMPEIPSAAALDTAIAHVKKIDLSVWLRTNASSAAEALLRLYAKSEARAEFREAASMAICQRLLRRLCDDCKQTMPVAPAMIQKLGGDPKQVKTLSRAFRLPPPEQRVDERGNPIEFPPCQTCGGTGFIGRIAIFEVIAVNDAVREALKKTPKVEHIDAAAKKTGARKTLAQNAYQLVLLGVTSIEEVQKVLSKK